MGWLRGLCAIAAEGFSLAIPVLWNELQGVTLAGAPCRPLGSMWGWLRRGVTVQGPVPVKIR